MQIALWILYYYVLIAGLLMVMLLWLAFHRSNYRKGDWKKAVVFGAFWIVMLVLVIRDWLLFDEPEKFC